ncbi:MAG: chemotaxis protein CheB, partial [Synergistaceae bacterium]
MHSEPMRVFILERSPIMMIKLLAFFENKPDVEVVEANQNIRSFIDEAKRFEVRELMRKLRPDVIILDLRSANKSELFWASKIKDLSFAPIIAFTSMEFSRNDRNKLGLFASVLRPDIDSVPFDITPLNKLLYYRRNINIMTSPRCQSDEKSLFPTVPGLSVSSDAPPVRFIAIGSSAGGTEALLKLVPSFPANMPCVIIVQHIAKGFADIFAEHLGRKTAMNVMVGYDGAPVKTGVLYIAPDGLQLTVEKSGVQFVIRCSKGERVSGHIPSADVLFSSAALCAGRFAIGVILTGMGHDGAEGLLKMKIAGAYTIGQDKETSLIYGMPKVAYNLGAVERQLPLEKIAGDIMAKL